MHPIHEAEKFNARSIRRLIARRIDRNSLSPRRVFEMSIDQLSSETVPALADEVCAAAIRLRISSPMFRLKFWYYDTHAPCCYFLAHGLTAAERDDILRYDGINAGYNIWDQTGLIEFDIGDLSERETPSRPLMGCDLPSEH